MIEISTAFFTIHVCRQFSGHMLPNLTSEIYFILQLLTANHTSLAQFTSFNGSATVTYNN